MNEKKNFKNLSIKRKKERKKDGKREREKEKYTEG